MNNFLRVIHVGVAFFVLFTAFNTCQSLVAQVFDDNHYGRLGFYSLAALYLTFAIGSFLSAPIIEKLGAKKSMCLGSFGYACWLTAGLLTLYMGKSETSKTIVWVLMIIAGMINGFGASVLWVGQGKYVTDGSTEANKGIHFGVVWSILMGSQIIGNIIGAFLINIFTQKVFFVVMGIMSVIGFLIFFTLTQPIVIPAVEIERLETQTLLGQSSDDTDIKLEKVALGLPKLNSSDSRHVLVPVDSNKIQKAGLRSTFDMLGTRKMLKVMQLMIFSGIVLAFFSGLLVKLITNTLTGDDSNRNLAKALYGMILFGVGEVVGSIVQGRIIDKTSGRIGVAVVMGATIITIVVSVITHSRTQYGVLWFGTAFGWGIVDSTSNTSISSIGGSQFSSDIEPFAIFKFIQSFFVGVFLIVESFMKDKNQLKTQRWYIISIGIYGIIACALTMSIEWKKRPQLLSKQLEKSN